MAAIKGRDTKPEMTVRRYLFAHGFRYRLHVATLPGKPDIVLPRYRTVVLVHGCFWHQHHGCPKARMPGTNTAFWKAKFDRNRERDMEVLQQLKALGWKVIVIWECELHPSKRERTLEALVDAIQKGQRTAK